MNGVANPLSIWPQAASASAVETDHLILSFTVLTLLLTVPIFLGFTWFSIKYRKGQKVDRSHSEGRSAALELTWMIGPFLLTLFFFAWGATMFLGHKTLPAGGLKVDVIGRQWMWKFQHPGGQGEINDLHVPTGQNVILHMISQDVIHALYVPALRIQMDVLPDRYTDMWFKADRPGTYHLFCSEYCGTDHSVMGGSIVIMEPSAYQQWLDRSSSDMTLAAGGEALFTSYGCAGCHQGTSTVRAPSLVGLYGKPVPLVDGTSVIADDSYIRDKILNPNARPIAGFKQVMPSFKGMIAEDDMLRLVAYVKSMTLKTGRAE
ncbi:MAG: cytochrome c oxidase subunit II [Janthinobacterium lividum]